MALTDRVGAPTAVLVALLLSSGCSGATPESSAPAAATSSTTSSPTTSPTKDTGPPQAADDPGTGEAGADGTGANGNGSGAEEAQDPPTPLPEAGDEGSDPSSSPTASEVPPASPSSAPTLPGLSSPAAPGPLVEGPLPPTGSAEGRLVTGFPTFLEPTRDSAVASSSLSAAAPVLQVTLSGSTARSPGRVLGEYRSRLVRKGMREQVAPASIGGSESMSFTRGGSTVTITVRRDGGTTSYSLFGILRAREG